jgi:Peptidase family M28
MKVSLRNISRYLLFFSLFLSFSLLPGEVSAVGGGYPGGKPPGDESEAIFIVSSRKPFDRDMLAGYGELLSCDAETARIRMTQSSADSLAGEGMEITRVMPALTRSRNPVIPSLKYPKAVAESEIRRMIERVDSLDIDSLLGNLSGENSVPIGGDLYTIRTRNSYQTLEVTRATQYCYEYMQGLDLSVSYDNYTWGSYNWRNVVAEQTGTLYPDQIYIICAHLDDMPEGSLAPGADDNGSGSVAVLLTASILSDYTFERTIRYLLFTGEEQGLIGSNYYVQDCVSNGDNILGALNFDMIAYDSNSDGSMEVYCGTMPASEAIGDLLIDPISSYGISLDWTKYTTAPAWSDQYRFWEAGYPAIVGIESFQDFNPNYHTTNDTRDNCDIPYLTEFVKAVVGTLGRLAAPVIVPSIIQSGDYNGDGTADPAIFRPSSGLWAIRGVTRTYFGTSGDIPISGDYSGDATADPGIFRSGTGLWAVRGVTRLYFGSSFDLPVPGDYNGDGCCDTAIFRENVGLWAIRGVSRLYFGSYGDEPLPDDYNGDGTQAAAIFRPVGGLWAIRDISRLYFGGTSDLPVPGNYGGDGTSDFAVFRPTSGLWAIRGLTRAYFGNGSDIPVPADYTGSGTDSFGIFRSTSGLWAVSGVTRVYFGSTDDIPVMR